MSDPTPAGMSWLDNFKSSAEKAATQAKQTLSEGATKMSSAIAASAQEYAPRRASGEDTRGGSAAAAAAAAETEPPASSSSGPAASSGPALEFVRLPVASAKKLRLLDKADVLALERAHAEERAALVAENDVARAVLRKHLADEKAVDEARSNLIALIGQQRYDGLQTEIAIGQAISAAAFGYASSQDEQT